MQPTGCESVVAVEKNRIYLVFAAFVFGVRDLISFLNAFETTSADTQVAVARGVLLWLEPLCPPPIHTHTHTHTHTLLINQSINSLTLAERQRLDSFAAANSCRAIRTEKRF